MNILGLSITHDGTLSIIQDGVHTFSLAEERVNRIKSYIGFPFKALRYVIDNNIINPDKLDLVAISTSVFLPQWAFTYAFELTEDKTYFDLQNEKKPSNFFINCDQFHSIKNESECKQYVKIKIKNLLQNAGIKCPIHFINHHLSHASSAYFSSGFKDALAITMDGEGDSLSASINLCKNGKINTISTTSDKASAGNLYSEVTRLCGYKISRHEGKITGLAAFGNFGQYQAQFDSLVKVSDGKLYYSDSHKTAREIINPFNSISHKDLAASIQNLLENKITEIISYWIDKTGIEQIVLAGGIFANVKINQYVSQIKRLKNIFVFPNMGDGGNAYGAAAYLYSKKNSHKPKLFCNPYLGPKFDNKYIYEILDKNKTNVKFYKSNNLEKETAQLIFNNKIIGWFQGRMEYGPRALGNRSILANPTDSNINEWLNERMHRTEFMPFAPSCLHEYANDLFHIPKESLKYPAEFMTITFKMKMKWAKKAPAVAHIDNTARPQLVKEKVNPRFYRLIKEYQKISGLPLLINTSFNTHEEPIVCKPEEGLQSLIDGVIDYFVVGDYICFLKNS